MTQVARNASKYTAVLLCILSALLLQGCRESDTGRGAESAVAEGVTAPSQDVGTEAQDQAPQVVVASSFDSPNPENPELPRGWFPYADNPRWGTMEMVNEGHGDNSGLQLAKDPDTRNWGSAAVHHMYGASLNPLAGKQVELSVWAKSTTDSLQAALVVYTAHTEYTVHRTGRYTTPGEWQQLQVRTNVPAEIVGVKIQLAALSPEPVIFDQVELRALPAD
jgi:hypothetical protein